jgi:hypothetical protein
MTKHKQSRVWILERGRYYADRGIVVCAAKSKAAMMRWIRSEYPNHNRSGGAANPGEIFMENDDDSTWLRCGPMDKCPLIQ